MLALVILDGWGIGSKDESGSRVLVKYDFALFGLGIENKIKSSV